MRARIKLATQNDRCIIDPQTSTWTRKWDLYMLCMLLFTAVVTPVEIAFLDEGRYISNLWWCNRVIDLAFLADMIIVRARFLPCVLPCLYIHREDCAHYCLSGAARRGPMPRARGS